ncbi:hypothetical protein D5086_005348 [Populus alba]
MHIASTGTGPVILFLHGFPELWYSWRHQLLSLSSVGYRCIAPDLRDYGDSDAPRSVSEYTGPDRVKALVRTSVPLLPRNPTWELMAPWTGSPITVPAKFIVGDLDLLYNIPGLKDHIHNGGFKKMYPFWKRWL